MHGEAPWGKQWWSSVPTPRLKGAREGASTQRKQSRNHSNRRGPPAWWSSRATADTPPSREWARRWKGQISPFQPSSLQAARFSQKPGQDLSDEVRRSQLPGRPSRVEKAEKGSLEQMHTPRFSASWGFLCLNVIESFLISSPPEFIRPSVHSFLQFLCYDAITHIH